MSTSTMVPRPAPPRRKPTAACLAPTLLEGCGERDITALCGLRPVSPGWVRAMRIPLDDATWERLPVTDVRLERVSVSQETVVIERVRALWNFGDRKLRPGASAVPRFVAADGLLVVVDGHHRTVASLLAGDGSVKGRILHLP